MKLLLVVLSAAVIAGLGSYAAFAAFNAFALSGERVTLHVDAFVAFISCIALVAALIALGLQAALVRSDRNAMKEMEQRIAQLEAPTKPQTNVQTKA